MVQIHRSGGFFKWVVSLVWIFGCNSRQNEKMRGALLTCKVTKILEILTQKCAKYTNQTHAD